MSSPPEQPDSLMPVATPLAAAAARVLFVDLDGTLTRIDLLHEAVLVLFKQSPRVFLHALLRLAHHGRAAFKRAISEAVTPEIGELPFRDEVLEFISEQRQLGRKVILATTSDSAWAQSVADELRVFDGILASDGASNLKGIDKLAAIQTYCPFRKRAGAKKYTLWVVAASLVPGVAADVRHRGLFRADDCCLPLPCRRAGVVLFVVC